MILLASYPKSGSTWLRALLSNFLTDGNEPVSINALITSNILNRHLFDECLGLSSAAMTDDEIQHYRPCFHEFLAAEAVAPVFAKVHQPFLHLPDGEPVFSPTAISGAVCIVRNPLDVAVSLAHHLQWNIDRTIAAMGDREWDISNPRGGIHTTLPDPYCDWSGNVSSWLDQDELSVHLLSYESLQADPAATLEGVVAFAGLSPAPERLAGAVENSRFHKLLDQEQRDGFKEKQPTAPSFFRKGQVGDWRNVLSQCQVRQLVARHGPVMARLGYLDEAEHFLGSACSPSPTTGKNPAATPL